MNHHPHITCRRVVLLLINIIPDINSSHPSATFMRQWIGSAVVSMMACRLFGAKPFSKHCCVIVNWTFRNTIQWKFNQNAKLFIHENAFENVVCEMATILSRGGVKHHPHITRRRVVLLLSCYYCSVIYLISISDSTQKVSQLRSWPTSYTRHQHICSMVCFVLFYTLYSES